MKKTFIILLILLAFYSCKKNDVEDCFVPTGEIIKQERAVSDFTDVEIRGFFDVIFTQDSVNGILVESGENIQPFISTEIVEGVLTIKNEIECNWVRKYEKPVIHLNVNNLRFVFMKEPCNVVSTNYITGENIFIWARADLAEANVKINCTNFRFLSSHRTAGIYNFEGAADYFDITVYGATKVFTDGLDANVVQAGSYSVGNIYVHANEGLKAVINSSGNIYYSGNPVKVETSITGSGKIIKQ